MIICAIFLITVAYFIGFLILIKGKYGLVTVYKYNIA